MQVNLISHPECNISTFWQDYLPDKTDIAVLDLTRYENFEEYIKFGMNPTARNRYRYAQKHYATDITDRNRYLDAMHEINTSAELRQNKPMRENYLQHPVWVNMDYKCEKHYAIFLGCFSHDRNKLVAYLVLQFAGDLCAVTQIIGHAKYLRDDIMLNLFAKAVEIAINANSKCIVYSRWTDGTDGLRHWKYSVGFTPGAIEIV